MVAGAMGLGASGNPYGNYPPKRLTPNQEYANQVNHQLFGVTQTYRQALGQTPSTQQASAPEQKSGGIFSRFTDSVKGFFGSIF